MLNGNHYRRELEIKWNDSLFCLDEDDDHVGIAELAETVAIK